MAQTSLTQNKLFNVVRILSGTGTYIPSPGTKFIKVKALGGGGGGGASGTTGTMGSPTAGAATTFGSLITANGGGAGANYSIDGNGGTPSTAIINAPALSIIVSQGNGGGAGGSGILIIEEYQ